MDYRSFLVHVEVDSTSSDARIELAASLARRYDATLIGVTGSALPPLPIADPYGVVIDGELIAAEEARLKEDLSATEDRFRMSSLLQGIVH